MDEKNNVINVSSIRKSYKKYDLRDMINTVIHQLHINNMTPALFFVFSRNQCEKLTSNISINLIDHKTRSSIIETFHKYMLPYKTVYEQLPMYHTLYDLLLKGVAYHHSGMVPILKEIVEILFGMGLIKVLIATETFAVGVNMPTKTVLFPSLEKYDNNGLRYLNHAEYMQMSGRAGRRGLDKIGNVLILPSMNLPDDNMLNGILNGKIKLPFNIII
jgi:antiviral helicase SKI2